MSRMYHLLVDAFVGTAATALFIWGLWMKRVDQEAVSDQEQMRSS